MTFMLITESYSLEDEAELFSHLPEPEPLSEDDLNELWEEIQENRKEYELGIPF